MDHASGAVSGQRPGQQRRPCPVRPRQTRMNARPLTLGDSQLMALPATGLWTERFRVFDATVDQISWIGRKARS